MVLPKSDSELETDEDTEEEEEIYIKAKKSKKQAPKKVYILKKNIIEEDSEESEEEIIKPVKAKFKSQQNKKSVIKVTENNKNTFPQYKNYFCD